MIDADCNSSSSTNRCNFVQVHQIPPMSWPGRPREAQCQVPRQGQGEMGEEAPLRGHSGSQAFPSHDPRSADARRFEEIHRYMECFSTANLLVSFKPARPTLANFTLKGEPAACVSTEEGKSGKYGTASSK